MAEITDKFGKASIDTDYAQATTVKTARTPGETVLAAFDLSKFPADTPVYFITYKKEVDPVTNEATIVNQTSWKALVNPDINTLTNLTLAPGYVDTGNEVGDYIESVPTSHWGNELVGGLLVSHNPDGTLAANSVNGQAIEDGAVDTQAIADGAVTTDNIDFATFPIQYGGANGLSSNNTRKFTPLASGLLVVFAKTRRNSGTSADVTITISATGVDNPIGSPSVANGTSDGFASNEYVAKVTKGTPVTITITASGGSLSAGGWNFKVIPGYTVYEAP